MKTNVNKHIRIGNMEYIHDPRFKKNFSYEHSILQWHPNSYFGKLDDYLKDGYVEKDGFVSKDNIHIDRRMFDCPEMNCVVAHLEFNGSNEYDVVSVGRRVIDLDKRDAKDLHRVMDIFDEDIIGSVDN